MFDLDILQLAFSPLYTFPQPSPAIPSHQRYQDDREGCTEYEKQCDWPSSAKRAQRASLGRIDVAQTQNDRQVPEGFDEHQFSDTPW